MSDLLLPVLIYFVNSIYSGIYTWSFLKGKYKKRTVLTAWTAACFCIQIVIFELLEGRFPFSEVMEIILNLCVLLSMQRLFFEKDVQKQFFIVFSFVAGEKIITYMTGIFSTAFTGLWNDFFDLLISKGMLNTAHGLYIWIDFSIIFLAFLCTLFYALVLYVYLFLINKKFARKDDQLRTQENVFLILTCIAALCILATLKMMVASVGIGLTVTMFDLVPAAKFWIPVICLVLLSAIIASVIMFQKLIEYNEETGKCAMLENQVRQMQKQVVEIQDLYADMRGLRHDMRSHLSNIALLVRNSADSDKEELENYIGKMEEMVGRFDFACQTGNPITDVIIHQKKQEAGKKQIRFIADFVYPSKLLIDVYDVAVILNNALENAVEACCRSKGEKQIKLYSYVKGSLFFIEVENDFSGEVAIHQESGLPLSSKENGNLHGIGISNIQRCAKKYMGDIDIEISETGNSRKFCLTVMMNGRSKAFTPKMEQFTPNL